MSLKTSKNHCHPGRLIRVLTDILKRPLPSETAPDADQPTQPASSNSKAKPPKKQRLSLPALKNTLLVVIAITLADTFRINEIARHLPIGVQREKHKQKRLLRFLDGDYPSQTVMRRWAHFVLQKRYLKTKGKAVLLVDEVDLLGPVKAIVAAVPFRKRAIPIWWKLYTNEQIQQMVYRSHNTLVYEFLEELKGGFEEALGKQRRFVLIFDRGFADVKLMQWLQQRRVSFLIRVRKNVGVEVEGYVGKLEHFPKRGYFTNVVYHKQARIRVHLYCAWQESEEGPLLIVSNEPGALLLLYRLRMQIEEAFRDLKSLFGFRALVLKEVTLERVEQLWLLNVLSMGLVFLLYEKSGYRWAQAFNDARKRFSLVHVIKRVLQHRWKDFRLRPLFSLPLLSADILSE
ncbi:IS4/IS5 family transposase [Candidatus Parcubacteria bacterium]|nr:MAG: IS4/IS5 family transposase [Candidatus Parcubacteria bacterium]